MSIDVFPGTSLLHGNRVVVVLNKADLPPRMYPDGFPGPVGPAVRASAKPGAGTEDLIRAIR